MSGYHGWGEVQAGRGFQRRVKPNPVEIVSGSCTSALFMSEVCLALLVACKAKLPHAEDPIAEH
jgi:hypothetical protein